MWLLFLNWRFLCIFVTTGLFQEVVGFQEHIKYPLAVGVKPKDFFNIVVSMFFLDAVGTFFEMLAEVTENRYKYEFLAQAVYKAM